MARKPGTDPGLSLVREGTWQTLAPQIWETVVVPCDCCGQVVAKRLWTVEVEGEERRFCSPECEQLYRDYVVERRA